MIMIADLVNPETGLTWRQENEAKTHKYSVDDLVEVVADPEYPSATDGMRLYVIGCVRDCDGTPLYVLGSKGMPLWQEAFVKPKVCYNFNSFSGFPEESLTLIRSSHGG